jgi:long-subunit acyl-CoA synthetase (AMP-forming)
VPLYDTLGEKAIEYVMSHSETKFVVAAGSKLAGLAKSLKGFKGKLLGVAYWGPAPEEAKQVSCTGIATALRLCMLLQQQQVCSSLPGPCTRGGEAGAVASA